MHHFQRAENFALPRFSRSVRWVRARLGFRLMFKVRTADERYGEVSASPPHSRPPIVFIGGLTRGDDQNSLAQKVAVGGDADHRI